MAGVGIALAAAAIAGLTMLLATRPVLERLPEPHDPPSTKPTYASLATPRFVGCSALLAAALTAGCWLLLPLRVQPLWLVLNTVGLLLAAIDARTTWLPLPLTRLAWLLMAVAASAGATLATVTSGGGLRQLGATSVGAAAAGGLYLLTWWLSRGGFGFGDVRFAPLVGAAAGAVSPTALLWSLLLGSLVGAGYGLVRLATGRRGAFPYAPAILAGGYLAVAADWLST